MTFLDERSRKVLIHIVDNPAATGKELEQLLSLSRKQLSYTLDKVNDYLVGNGYMKIERQKTGKFTIPATVIEEFKTDQFTFEEASYIYSDKERLDLIVLILLCHQDELSTYDFTIELGISKNTFLSDLKKLHTYIHNNYGVSVLYSRKDGYNLIGSEYAKRELLIASIRKVLNMPNGSDVIKKICKIDVADLDEIHSDISEIEKKLQIQFTDERLKELPYILCLVIRRVHSEQLLDAIPEAFQHIIGTKEYSVTASLSNKYQIENQLERMFISAQIQISNIHYLKADEYKMEKKLMKAANEMITNFEDISCIQIKEREQLLEAVLQHCKPAFYRMKYNYHIENSILDMVLPQHSYLHEMVRKSSKPFAQLVGHEIVDDELVYLTVLFGAWLRKEGVLDIVEEKKRAVVVCTNGISVSNFLYVTLTELFPEIDFLTCLSIRGFQDFEEDYELVFSTVRLESEKTQFLVTPFLNEYSKQSFREKVLQEIEGVNLHRIQISSIVNIVEESATIHDKDQLIKDLKQYLSKEPNTKKEESILQRKREGILLSDLLNETTIQISEKETDWKDAIRIASAPLLENKDIEERYVDKMITSICEEQPFIMIAEGVIIAHAGIDDGVNKVSMGILRMPSKISIYGYMNADIIVVLGTPDRTEHLTALYKFIEVSESNEKMRAIRQAKKVDEIVQVIRK